MWFEKLTGFRESTPDQVRSQIVVDGEKMTSQANGREMHCGRLEIPSLDELRSQLPEMERNTHRLQIEEVVADVQQLHMDPANANALFQVASQYNLLEMVSPTVTPEVGVGIYENDRTQGPACAVACGAGTIYRNYFVPVNGKIGQTATHQIDCLADLGTALGNEQSKLWRMKNGYALATAAGLKTITSRIKTASESEVQQLRCKLRIGLQWNTEVTMAIDGHRVSQAYCSALPVAYSEQSEALWSDFAQLVLEASYEATVCAAIINLQKTGCNKLFLTQIGGGVFGNRSEWILQAILRALRLFISAPLDVKMVSYRQSNSTAQSLIEQFRATSPT